MTYGSVCSGIEAATAAWEPLGWKPSFFSEIDPFPCAVLKYRYPNVPLHGDFTTIQNGDYEPIRLLVGGTPCQSFSIAGLRAGLDDDRGNLALEFCRLAQRLRPQWLVWENVPGVLSSNGGRDFGSILGALAELGYGLCYRILDAQHFGVPQRRRRVFVVGYFGDWRRAAAVLFERTSLSGNPPPSRKARQENSDGVRDGIAGGIRRGQRHDDNDAEQWRIIPELSPCLTQNYGKQPDNSDTSAGPMLIARDVAPTIRSGGNRTGGDRPPGTDVDTLESLIAFNSREDCISSNGHFGALQRTTPQAQAIVIPIQEIGKRQSGTPKNGVGYGKDGDPMYTLQKSAEHGIMTRSTVRRLTPRECERLQGFPDDYTLVPVRGKPAADGPRYKAIGNSMAVPVMRWIGERISMVEGLEKHG